MEELIYKGIVFDEYTIEKNGDIWAEMCESCTTQYNDIIKNELDDGDTACGCCSVKGCCNNGADPNSKHFYIDFETKITEVKTHENNPTPSIQT